MAGPGNQDKKQLKDISAEGRKTTGRDRDTIRDHHLKTVKDV